MKSDEFIREVEEELRQDKLKLLWDKYGLFAVAAVAAIIAGTAGFVGWQAWQDSAGQERARAYIEALDQITEDGDNIEVLESYAGTADTGFGTIARLRVAAMSADDGDLDRAVANWSAVVDDASADPIMRDLAAISLASREIDTGNLDAANQLLAPIAAGTGAFRNTALELQAMASIADGDLETAREQFARLKDDALLDNQQRQRIEELLSAIGGDGTE